MAIPLPDPETHLFDSLLHGAAGETRGAYNSHDAWTVHLGESTVTSPAARLVTVHEVQHAALNDCTSYGIALAVYAVLALDDDRQRAALQRLVTWCRAVHEAFATYQSLSLVADGDPALLAGYPSYQRHYKAAANLAQHTRHRRLQELAVETTARVCMQTPALQRLLEAGLSPESTSEIPRFERPDERFRLVQAHADGDFWTAAWDRCRSEAGASWAHLLDVDAPDDPAVWQVVAHAVHDQMAALLGRHGATVLAYDDHRDFTARAIDMLQARAPHHTGRLLASQDSVEADVEAYEVWRRERLVVREAPRRAVIRTLQELAAAGRAALVSGDGEHAHVFGTARPAFRLLQQFAFSAEDRGSLEEQGAATVVFLRTIDDDGEVECTLLAAPSDLALVCSAMPRRKAVLINVALSSLGDIPWRDRWSDVLTRTRVTGLIDLAPLAQFDLWRDTGESLTYAQATVRDGNDEPAALFACVVGDTNLRLLLPCSETMGDVLAGYLAARYPAARFDPTVLTKGSAIVEATVSHLLAEEHYFDVSAYHWEDGRA
ncbi:hypothetical protein ACIBO9_48975 [Streptomyces prunicolor]|uniref:hypothetical protein n=1 Tax=Streptomyces prunicolor TaxID=67348 RepID=UPI0037D17FD2